MTANLEKHEQALARNPEDARAFDALEEGYFLEAAWEKLVDLYDARLGGATQDPRQRASLLHRAGQILEERCLDTEQAVERYTQAITQDPTFRPALQQLRQLHAERGAWDLVLQIAEVEIGAPMAPYERAEFFAEMGEVWLLRIAEPSEAMTCFEQALGIDPSQKRALEGLARTLETTGQMIEAAAAWERLIELLRGPDRAPACVALARILAGPLAQTERAVECYRRALEDDPRNGDAVEALVYASTARQDWRELGGLFEKRFAVASGARRRTAIALEAARLHSDRLDDLEAASRWLERAAELSGDDVAVHEASAALARRAGDDDGLLRALDRVVELAEGPVPRDILLEVAGLHAERADDAHALACLEQAQASHPDDRRVLSALSDTLANLGRYEELASVLERRAELAGADPESRAAVLTELGELFHGPLDDTDAARDAFERAFDTCPASAGAAETLESIYRKDEAWESLRGMLERAADDGIPDARCAFRCSLGELLRTRFDDPSGSAREYDRALELQPNSARALQGLAAVARDAGDEDGLIALCEREAGIASEPQRVAELSRELARLYEARGRSEEALALTERVLSVSPDDREALETMARLQDVPGQEDALISTLYRLEELVRAADQAGIRRRIAELHMTLGQEDLAVACWERALESHPDDRASLLALRDRYAALSRAEDLAPVLRKLADVLPAVDQPACLEELAALLEESLGDLDGAIVVLWRLAALPGRSPHVGPRLEALLERAGRFEELAQHLNERRRALPDESDEAIELDMRRGWLLVDPLGQFEEAAGVFRSVRERDAGRREAAEGLERALRAANDSSGLAQLLEGLASDEPDAARVLGLRLERAVLLEDELDRESCARSEYEALAADTRGTGVEVEAALRLERLLERCGDWEALRERLEAEAARATGDEECALHERIALLCRDRVGDLAGAADHLESAGRLAPAEPRLFRELGAIYEELGRTDDLLRATEAELEAGTDAGREALLHARAAALRAAQPDGDEAATPHYERLLDLAPGHPEATEFLVERYERLGQFADVDRVLVARLASLGAAETSDAGADRGLRTSLALRLAVIRSEQLGELDGAIDALESAMRLDGPVGPATTPLADLYRLGGREEELVELCRQAADASTDLGERAVWLLRLGDELKENGHPERAATAYERALRECPDQREPEDALCDLYRKTGNAGPLVELLERRLGRGRCGDEIAIRMELARLHEEHLARPADALDQLRRVALLEPDHAVAFDHALQLAKDLDRHDDQLRLIDARLERRMPARERADLLERRADLLAGPIGAGEQSLATYREALALDPTRRTARESLRHVLEKLGRFTAVLDCLHVEAREADGDERVAIFERAVEIASENVGPDAALPWLERLRAERPADPDTIARIADVHRMAGRFESVLRAIEDELALGVSPARVRELQLGRARIFERDMASPGRAIAALEAALAAAPEDTGILEKLDAFYAAANRPRQRVAILERRLESAVGEPLALHCEAATLYREALSDPTRAIPHLLCAVALTDAGRDPESARSRLDDLAQALRAAGDPDGWARASEALLELFDAEAEDDGPEAASHANQLRGRLAVTYLAELRDSRAALVHLRAIVGACAAGEATPPGLSPDEFEALEQAMLERLRAENNPVELEQRLSERLQRCEGTCDEWLELARLRDEQLHAPQPAREAYQQALARDAGALAAIRGFRHLSEFVSDWAAVAEAIELELALPDAEARRAPLFRKLGSVCWHHLDDTDRAVRAYRDALEADTEDIVSLRCLEQLHERREEWGHAASRYEREVEVLGDSDPARRYDAWIAVAGVAHERTGESQRALRAYEEASAIAPLEPTAQLKQALLYRASGDSDRFVVVYAGWCDDPSQPADCADQLLLVDALVALERESDALERAGRIAEAFPEDTKAWEALARLHERAGDLGPAGVALERAAALRFGGDAAGLFVAAALLVEETDRQSAYERLRRAVENDPASPTAHAHLARVAHDLGCWEAAEEAAGRSLDLAGACAGGADDGAGSRARLETALVGGRAARERERLEAATLFYGTALEIAPDHCEALDAQGELLFERGDLDGACDVTKRRLALAPERVPDGEPARRAHAERLSRLAAIQELHGDVFSALERYELALESVPGHGAAHSGRARLHAKAGRIDAAVEALTVWAESDRRAGDLAGYGQRLLQAAELESDEGRGDVAKQHLRRSIGACPTNARSWVLLAEQIFEEGRIDALLRLIPEALTFDAVADVDDAVARLALLYARGLSARGELALAREAYGLALERDGRCAEAALEVARLRRAEGAWQAAAETLQRFCDTHPEPGHRDLAEASYKLADLRAGPLEDVEGAIRCYERALDIWPEHPRAREPLATLLGHLPQRFTDAVHHHGLLLESEPTRGASIRALARLAAQRGDEAGSDFGLALLRALGATSPAEREGAPASILLERPPTGAAAEASLEDPLWESVRSMTVLASEAIEQLLASKRGRRAARGFGDDPEEAHQNPLSAVLRETLDELSAPGLAELGDEALRDVLYRTAAVASGDESDGTHGGNELTLGRWTRRKIRRALDDATPEDVRAIDPSAWRVALHGLAAERTLERSGGDLRAMLVSLCDARGEVSESDDLCARLAGDPLACALLRRLERAWCQRLGRA